MEIKGSRKRKLEEKGKETISLAINTVDIRTDMKEAKNIDEEDEEEFEFMKNLPMQDLRSILDERGISYKNVLEKNELLEMIKSQLNKEKKKKELYSVERRAVLEETVLIWILFEETF